MFIPIYQSFNTSCIYQISVFTYFFDTYVRIRTSVSVEEDLPPITFLQFIYDRSTGTYQTTITCWMNVKYMAGVGGIIGRTPTSSFRPPHFRALTHT